MVNTVLEKRGDFLFTGLFDGEKNASGEKGPAHVATSAPRQEDPFKKKKRKKGGT